jgi:hypothetical protein
MHLLYDCILATDYADYDDYIYLQIYEFNEFTNYNDYTLIRKFVEFVNL